MNIEDQVIHNSVRERLTESTTTQMLSVPWSAPDGFDADLQPTRLCNFRDPSVQAKAIEIINDAQTPQQAAMRIFTFVRDEIKFGLVYPVGETATMTLARGVGQCSAKANLQVALLRAAQIPARYHIVAVDRTSLRRLVPGPLYRLFTPSLWHPWAECYLGKRWVGCDTLIDRQLYMSAIQQRLIESDKMPTIDWDGSEDLLLLKPWILEEVSVTSDLEEGLSRMPKAMVPPRSVAKIAFAYSNWYTERLRR